MILGIDASNLRGGGGLTHLAELLRAAEPSAHGFSQIIVWGGAATLERLEERPWLAKSRQPALEGGLPRRLAWQRFQLPRQASQAGCALLFAPGGSHGGGFRPVVTMSRNMLPFEWRELRRYGLSWTAIRLALLRLAQARTYRRADGLIFLTRYARERVEAAVGATAARTTTIPHGIDGRFLRPPRPPRALAECSADRPFRILYVSIIDVYKHQWRAAEAVAALRAEGLPVALDLAGPAYPPALARLRRTLERVDPAGECVRYLGPAPHADLPGLYAAADVCLFASSCENMPNILLEGMASGLPVACARRGPMPEILGEAGAWFDPEDPADIARALRELAASPARRAELAAASFERSRQYSWRRCADETFAFLAATALQPPPP